MQWAAISARHGASSAALALKRHRTRLGLYGDATRLRSLLAQYPDIAARLGHHAEVAVAWEKPAPALPAAG
jgi:hypothetical protein